jgi:hypothetical protein
MAAGQRPAALQTIAAEIDQLGAAELLGTSAVTASILGHDERIVSSLAARNGGASRALASLRAVVADLDPGRGDASDRSDRIAQRYAARVDAAEARLTDAAAVLGEARDDLRLENATIAQQERALWLQMRSLRRYALLAERLDAVLTSAVGSTGPTAASTVVAFPSAAAEAPHGTVGPELARRVSVDVLLPLRQRRQELLTHLAVAAQSYAALRMIEATNGELVRTIDAALATSTTVVRAAALAIRSVTGARQLGEPVTATTIREAATTALAALSDVNRSRSDVLATMQATLRSLQSEAGGLAVAWAGPGVADEAR